MIKKIKSITLKVGVLVLAIFLYLFLEGERGPFYDAIKLIGSVCWLIFVRFIWCGDSSKRGLMWQQFN